MADDEKDKDEGFDPWADLEADGAEDGNEGFSFSFEDVSLDGELGEKAVPAPVAGESADQPASQAEPEAAAEVGAEGAPDSHDDEAFASAWLDESADAMTDPPLALFAPDEQAEDAAASDVEPPADASADHEAFGTADGETARDPAEAADADLDVLALLGGDEEPGQDDEPPAATDDLRHEPISGEQGEFSFDDEGAAATEGGDVIDFGMAAAGMAVSAATGGSDAESSTAVLPRPSAPKKRRAKGGIGQLVGVVVGGLLAIPIVLGILIGLMWLGWRDTVGIRKWMPEQLAFLLPTAAVRSADPGTTGGPDLSTAPSLDDLPAMVADGDTDAATASVPEETAPADPLPADPAEPPVVGEPLVDAKAVTAADPAEIDGVAPPMKEEPAAPSSGETASEESADPFASLPAEPSLDDLVAPAPTEPVMPADAFSDSPEPVASAPVAPVAAAPVVEPLDLASLEVAVAEADAALEAVRAEPELGGLARKKLLVEWYRHLVRTAQELALVERVATDSGRPLDAPPEAVVTLGTRVLAATDLADDLAKLGRDWLGYTRREGDGVVLPATFIGTRLVGPFSSSRISLADAGGTSREVAVISRAVPAAVEGDRVLVIGLVMDGGVIWASDVRSAGGTEEVVEPEPTGATEPDPLGLQVP